MLFIGLSIRRFVSTTTSLPYKKVAKLNFDLYKPHHSTYGKLPIHCQEPLIFLHGIYGYSKSFSTDYQQLSNLLQTPVYSIDMRCHGESENCLPFNYETLADDLDNFVITHNLNKPSLLGFSLGAKLAMVALLRSPQLYTSGVIVDNVPLKQDIIKPNLTAFGNALKSVIHDSEIRRHDPLWISKSFDKMKKFCGDMPANFYLFHNIQRKASLLKEYSSDKSKDGLFCKVPIAEISDHFIENVPDWPEEALKEMQTLSPILLIKASHSGFVKEEGLAALKKHFPNLSVTEIAGTHLVMKERPQEYLSAVGRWFYEQNSKKITPSDKKVKTYKNLSQQVVVSSRKVSNTDFL
ncbi:Ethanol acetyltransferase 2 [Hanseniaspora guilliermondii]